MNHLSRNPLVVALGATIAGTLALSTPVSADTNPFGATPLSEGYMLAFSSRKDEEAEGECGEGKAGEGSCGEGKDAEGHCGEEKGAHEGSCGEGKTGEGSCGEGKTGEGACGEGKCGANK